MKKVYLLSFGLIFSIQLSSMQNASQLFKLVPQTKNLFRRTNISSWRNCSTNNINCKSTCNINKFLKEHIKKYKLVVEFNLAVNESKFGIISCKKDRLEYERKLKTYNSVIELLEEDVKLEDKLKEAESIFNAYVEQKVDKKKALNKDEVADIVTDLAKLKVAAFLNECEFSNAIKRAINVLGNNSLIGFNLSQSCEMALHIHNNLPELIITLLEIIKSHLLLQINLNINDIQKIRTASEVITTLKDDIYNICDSFKKFSKNQ